MNIEEQYADTRDDILDREAWMVDDNPYAYILTILIYAIRLRLRLNPWFFV